MGWNNPVAIHIAKYMAPIPPANAMSAVPSTIRRWAGSLPDTFNQQPITSTVSNRNGVVSNATKPRKRLSGSDCLGRQAVASGISSA
jgi:hypothetical protein